MKAHLLKSKQRHVVKASTEKDTLVFKLSEIDKIVGDDGRLVTFDLENGRSKLEWYEERKNQIYANNGVWLVQYSAILPAARYGFQFEYLNQSRLGFSAGWSGSRRLSKQKNFYDDVSLDTALNEYKHRALEVKMQTTSMYAGVLYRLEVKTYLTASVGVTHSEKFQALYDPEETRGIGGVYYVASNKPDRDGIGFTVGGLRFINQQTFWSGGVSTRPLGLSLGFGFVAAPLFTKP